MEILQYLYIDIFIIVIAHVRGIMHAFIPVNILQ